MPLDLKKRIEALQKENDLLKHLAERDFLTGVYNRHGFIKQAEKFFDAIRKNDVRTVEGRRFVVSNISVIFVDLDDLKKLNDKYGHKAGDRFVKAAAEIFSKNLRDFDVIGRWGGDEFALALINAEEKDAVIVAEKLKNKFSAAKIAGLPKSFKPGASFGIVSVKRKGGKVCSDLRRLIEKADTAMYRAKKKKGKGLVIFYK